MSEKFKFITSALGIFICYFYFGILHEKITRGFYGEKLNEDGTKGERFEFPLTLVGMQIGFNWMFARGELNFPIERLKKKPLKILPFPVLLCVRKQPKDKTYFLYYACGALTSLLSAFFTNLALRWVNVRNFNFRFQKLQNFSIFFSTRRKLLLKPQNQSQ